jgi:replicative DNA helicase
VPDILSQLELYKAQSKVNPQKENGHIRINNDVFDSLYKINYNYTSTLPIVLFILRKTWGWDKKVDKVTGQQIQDNTPYHKRAVIRGLREAEMRRILIIERQLGKPNKILFNKYFDTWITSVIRVTSDIDGTGDIKDTTIIEITSKPVTQTALVTKKAPVSPMSPTGDTDGTGTGDTDGTGHTSDLHSPITNVKPLLINQYIYSHWNSKKIIVHKKLTQKMRVKINSALKDYSKEDIIRAIDNYDVVLKGEDYYWDFSWTLCDFLQRGLERFMDNANPLKCYLKREQKEVKQKLTQPIKTKTSAEVIKTEIERPIPCDKEAEKAVCGSILIDGDCINELVFLLKPDDFFTIESRFVYTACLEVMKRGEGINQITVARQLAYENKLSEIGGVAFLSYLVADVPTSAHAEYYARIVKNLSISRRAIALGYKIQELGYSEIDPVKILSGAGEGLLELQKEVSMPSLISPSDLALKGHERYAMLKEGKRKGVFTGFGELDEDIGGLFGGELCYIAARTGVGKTELALNIGEYIGQHHGPVGMFSLEQPWGDILDRYVSRELQISPRKIRAGNYSDDLMGNITTYMGKVSEMNMYFYNSNGDIDGRGATTQSIYALSNHMKMAYGLSAIIIDYLSFIADENRHGDYERISEISRKLKKLTGDLDVPVFCVCQLNREPEKRMGHKPQLSDIRESGHIEEDADTILFLHRADKYEDEVDRLMGEGKNREDIIGKAEIIIGKQRQAGEFAGVSIPIYWDFKKRKYYDKYILKATPEQFR